MQTVWVRQKGRRKQQIIGRKQLEIVSKEISCNLICCLLCNEQLNAKYLFSSFFFFLFLLCLISRREHIFRRCLYFAVKNHFAKKFYSNLMIVCAVCKMIAAARDSKWEKCLGLKVDAHKTCLRKWVVKYRKEIQ